MLLFFWASLFFCEKKEKPYSSTKATRKRGFCALHMINYTMPPSPFIGAVEGNELTKAFLDGVGKALSKAQQGLADTAQTINSAAQETDLSPMLCNSIKIYSLCVHSLVDQKIFLPDFPAFHRHRIFWQSLFFLSWIPLRNRKDRTEDRNSAIAPVHICLINFLIKSGVIFLQGIQIGFTAFFFSTNQISSLRSRSKSINRDSKRCRWREIKSLIGKSGYLSLFYADGCYNR